MTSDMRSRKRGRPSLARKAEEMMRREVLIAAGAKVLVMVSGGQDSMALLHVLCGGDLRRVGPFSLHVLHVNHHLRGADSDADEVLVAQICSELGVGVTVVHCPVDKRAGNVQEAAREARRAAALQEAESRACDRIALAHTADDQVETMLYRLGRYGGLAALAGMRPSDPPWVRPLLSCRREETAAYCREQGLDFARDRGNEYPGYARTPIRREVIPAWESSLPGAVEAACRAAEVAGEMQDLVGITLAEAGARVGLPAGGMDASDETELSATALLSLSTPVRRLLLHRWLEAHARPAASRASVLACESLLRVRGSAERALGGGLRVRKEYDRLYLGEGVRKRTQPPPPVALPVPGRADWGGLAVQAERVYGFRAPDVGQEAYVDADSLDGPLWVRGPEKGDRIRPLGATGHRKLKDIFVDLRVPVQERAHRPLIVCGEQVIWVCGLMVAEEAKINRETSSIVRLSLARLGVGPRKQSETKP